MHLLLSPQIISDQLNLMSALNRLPQDLIESILLCLPPKSLGRFKLVSKQWYSLISSPNFIKNHILNHTQNNPDPNSTHLMLIPEYSDSLYSVDIKQLINTQTAPAIVSAKRMNFHKQLSEIVGSCNGLLLVNDKHDNLHLVNPTTWNSLEVPDSGVGSLVGTYGFGYDSSKDDYKVISIYCEAVSDYDRNCTSVHVYSLRSNSWNMLLDFPSLLFDFQSLYTGVLINNNLHWVVRSRHSTLAIVAFSVADEEFHEIELPDSVNYDRVVGLILYAFGGKLVVVPLQDPEFFYELWVMEEYGVPKSWVKLCIINNDKDLNFELFAQMNNRDILLGNNKTYEICIYNMDERRCTSIKIEGLPERVMVYDTYVESLESPVRFR